MKWTILPAIMFLISLASSAQEIPSPFEVLNINSKPADLMDEIFLMDSVHVYLFPPGSEDSMLMQKEYLDYSDHGLILRDSSIARYYDTTQWFYFAKREYEYDEHQRLLTRFEYQGTNMNNTWIPYYRYFYFYIDDSQQMDYSLRKFFQNQAWENRDSNVYSYNAQMQLEFMYRYIWDQDSNYFYINSYNHYAYNAQGLVTGDTTYSYWEPGVATKSYLRVYTYDAGGNELTHTAYQWNGAQSAWDEVEMHVNGYNAQGNRITNYRYEWDEDLGQWDNIERGFFSYDENDNIRLWMYWEKDETTGIWEKDFTMELNWGLHSIVNIFELPGTQDMQVFPNPTSGLLNVNTSQSQQISVFDLGGKLVYISQLSPGQNALDLSQLKPGIYVLVNEDRSLRQKIILK